jgi:two-component system OmpR family response regulator
MEEASAHAMSLPTFLVEDNVLIQTNLIAALEELAGARIVGVAPSELRAVDWLEGHPGDWKLAVVDLFLVQGTGLGVVDACRRRAADQRVVVLTNYPTADIAQKALAKGADALFDKSVGLDAFFEFCTAHRLALHL